MQPTVDPLHVAINEPVRDSDIPVQLMYVEMIDGAYSPIGLRVPPAEGPFPVPARLVASQQLVAGVEVTAPVG